MQCETCGRQTLHRRREPNHVLWAILTIFSCGLFGIVWLLDTNSAQKSPWLCTTCGTPFPVLMRQRTQNLPSGPASKRDLIIAAGIVCAVVVLVVIVQLAKTRREAAERAHWASVPTSQPPMSPRNPTHERLASMTTTDREGALAGYVRAAGHHCGAAMQAQPHAVAPDGSATWDVTCPDGAAYSITIKGDAAGTGSVIRAKATKH